MIPRSDRGSDVDIAKRRWTFLVIRRFLTSEDLRRDALICRRGWTVALICRAMFICKWFQPPVHVDSALCRLTIHISRAYGKSFYIYNQGSAKHAHPPRESMVFPPFCGNKKAHGFVLIHALGGLYSVVREFGSLQKGKNTFFTSTKSLVKISTVETANPPIKSGGSWAISFSLPFDVSGD